MDRYTHTCMHPHTYMHPHTHTDYCVYIYASRSSAHQGIKTQSYKHNIRKQTCSLLLALPIHLLPIHPLLLYCTHQSLFTQPFHNACVNRKVSCFTQTSPYYNPLNHCFDKQLPPNCPFTIHYHI